MPGPHFYQTDLIQELRLRRWARKNYVPLSERGTGWHPVVLDEMHCRDQELDEQRQQFITMAYVPLAPTVPTPRAAATYRALPSGVHVIHEPHVQQAAPRIVTAPETTRVFLC